MSEWLQTRRDRFGQREFAPPLLASAALVTFVVYDRIFNVVDGPITCAFRALTGLPCPGCGLTRSVVALGNGELGHSIAEHPLGLAIVLLLFAVVVSWVVGVALNRAPRRVLTRRVLALFAFGFAVLWLARLL